MNQVLTELLALFETKDDAVVLLKDEFFESLSPSDRKVAIESIFTLGREKLMADYSRAPAIPVELSRDPAHEPYGVVLRALVDETGEFTLLVYWGGKVRPEVTLPEALTHAAKLLSVAEATLLGGEDTP